VMETGEFAGAVVDEGPCPVLAEVWCEQGGVAAPAQRPGYTSLLGGKTA
jgi:hypothetical protein